MFEFKITSPNDSEAIQPIELSLCGDLSIANISQLKELIVDKFSSNQQLVVDLSQATSFDFSLFQLLCSAHRYAQKHDKRFKLKDQVTDEFITQGRGLGFIQNSACKDAITPEHCLWIDKNLPNS